ncbi:tail collar domain [Volucribacter psittacicida]|uniref:Tail collar domain n=1 Tax=Volucribacter psittacicida TaxID=203482 RepID=A0A4R1G1E3_9PAST|nr:phage tail protein [Volucribacter psittacicida]TCJ98838.1 tail collar domain [Volucribacter psittacicida]
MASLITKEFEKYIANQTTNSGTVILDEFIFANIPGLTEQNLANYLTIPNNSQIVHRQAISQKGVVNENSVVYSITIGTEIGDFDFNFIGLINKSNNMLAVAISTNTIKKIKNKDNIQGNSITRSVLLEFAGAKQLTNINVNANTWQIDFTARLQGIDEKIRLTNRDLYGRAVFFDESFLVTRKSGNQFYIEKGTAYIEGVRADLTSKQTITAATLPCSIYIDVVHHCTVTGRYETEIKFLQQNKNDYIDSAGYQHYVQIIADIDRNANVTDRRLLSFVKQITPKKIDENTKNTADNTGHTHEIAKASTSITGIVQLVDNLLSNANNMALTAKQGRELKRLIDGLGTPFQNFSATSSLDNTTNLNDLKGARKYGVYSQSSNSNALTALNYPEQKAGTLFVLPSAYQGIQLYVPFDNQIIYIRRTNQASGFENWLIIGDVIDNLNSDSKTAGLSARQGKFLNDNKVDRAGDTITGDLVINGKIVVNDFTFNCTTPNWNGLFFNLYDNGTTHNGGQWRIEFHPKSNEETRLNMVYKPKVGVQKYIAFPTVYTNREVIAYQSWVTQQFTGAICAFAMTTPPAGWLRCNGAAVSRTTYADLFQAIGTTFGAGNGSTTFNLPDLRGEFVRGFDDGRGVDSSRGFGSWQNDEIKEHKHQLKINGVAAGNVGPWEGALHTGSGKEYSTENFGGNETRPRNVALLYCIKY